MIESASQCVVFFMAACLIVLVFIAERILVEFLTHDRFVHLAHS